MYHPIGYLEETHLEGDSFPRVPTSEGDLFVMFKVCFLHRLTLQTWWILKWIYSNLSLYPEPPQDPTQQCCPPHILQSSPCTVLGSMILETFSKMQKPQFSGKMSCPWHTPELHCLGVKTGRFRKSCRESQSGVNSMESSSHSSCRNWLEHYMKINTNCFSRSSFASWTILSSHWPLPDREERELHILFTTLIPPWVNIVRYPRLLYTYSNTPVTLNLRSFHLSGEKGRKGL